MRGADDINLSWLLRLRWGAIAGQATTIAVVEWGFAIRLPVAPLAAILAFESASNVAWMMFARRGPPAGPAHLFALLALDIVTLTALLYFSGGPYNPFSFLYLVYIALAAVVLRVGWTWLLALLAVLCFAALFVRHTSMQHHLRMHVEGMGVAFAVAVAFIVHFMSRITRALARREDELMRARAAAGRW